MRTKSPSGQQEADLEERAAAIVLHNPGTLARLAVMAMKTLKTTGSIFACFSLQTKKWKSPLSFRCYVSLS